MSLTSFEESCFVCGISDSTNTTCPDCLSERDEHIGLCRQHRYLHTIPSTQSNVVFGSCYPYEIATDAYKGR